MRCSADKLGNNVERAEREDSDGNLQEEVKDTRNAVKDVIADGVGRDLARKPGRAAALDARW